MLLLAPSYKNQIKYIKMCDFNMTKSGEIEGLHNGSTSVSSAVWE